MFATHAVRKPAVSGLFYPSDPVELKGWVDPAGALPPKVPGKICAWIAPHAGYVYSGKLAAAVYAGVKRADRVWLLGPSHHVFLRQATVCPHAFWRTPLGDAALDTDTVSGLLSGKACRPDAVAHAPEHALETHLPFLQTRLPGIPFVPVLTAAEDSEALADVLVRNWREGDVLAVSSDLSHFLSDEAARDRDAETAHAIECGDAEAVNGAGACGWVAVRTLLRLADAFGWRVRRTGLVNSAEVTGDRTRVVGYGGWWFYEEEKTNVR